MGNPSQNYGESLAIWDHTIDVKNVLEKKIKKRLKTLNKKR